ncbi:MAG: hypothetical protein MHM6MM_008281 [Cercozoa sp. M6MM]
MRDEQSCAGCRSLPVGSLCVLPCGHVVHRLCVPRYSRCNICDMSYTRAAPLHLDLEKFILREKALEREVERTKKELELLKSVMKLQNRLNGVLLERGSAEADLEHKTDKLRCAVTDFANTSDCSSPVQLPIHDDSTGASATMRRLRELTGTAPLADTESLAAAGARSSKLKLKLTYANPTAIRHRSAESSPRQGPEVTNARTGAATSHLVPRSLQKKMLKSEPPRYRPLTALEMLRTPSSLYRGDPCFLPCGCLLFSTYFVADLPVKSAPLLKRGITS